MAYIYTRAADAGVGAARAQRRVADFLQDPQQLDVAFGVGSSPGLNAARLIERKGRSLKKLFGHAHIFVDARTHDRALRQHALEALLVALQAGDDGKSVRGGGLFGGRHLNARLLLPQ